MADEYSEPPALLSPGRLRQCEAWKLAYADFLLRAELYGLRAELLAVRFLPDDSASAQALPTKLGGSEDGGIGASSFSLLGCSGTS
jgi:hypothetical protein